MKLFEIPVYALQRNDLAKRVGKAYENFREQHTLADEETVKRGWDRESFPQRLWDYNHIWGYIVISKIGDEIEFLWYSPKPTLQRYRWKSIRKHYLQGEQLSGYHFYTGNIVSGVQLETRINELLMDFTKKLEKKGYYPDLEAFNSINPLIDYDKLLRG